MTTISRRLLPVRGCRSRGAQSGAACLSRIMASRVACRFERRIVEGQDDGCGHDRLDAAAVRHQLLSDHLVSHEDGQAVRVAGSVHKTIGMVLWTLPATRT